MMIFQRKENEILEEYDAIKQLKQKCSSIEGFREKTADKIIIYAVETSYVTKAGKEILAIAQYGNIYAIYSPEYLTDEDLIIFQSLLDDVEDEDHLVVFRKRDYDAINKYFKGRNEKIRVELFN